MKKFLSIAVVAILALGSTAVNAQMRVGAQAGLNLANFKSDVSPSMRVAYNIGVVADYGINDNFAVGSGLLLSSKGAKIEEAGVTQTASPLYLEIPINAIYRIDLGAAKWNLYAGPYVGIGVAGKIETEGSFFGQSFDSSESIQYDDTDMKRLDIGLNVGTGIEFNKFFVNAQYGVGLTDIDATGSSSTKNLVIGINVGYMFGGK